MVHEWSDANARKWNMNWKVAMIGAYQPEIDISDELRDELVTRFQQMIDILQWSVEFGRIDIINR